MKSIKKINIGFATNTILIFLVSMFAFHILIISNVISYENVWGGRLQSREQMLVFESISIIINLFVLFIVLIKGKFLEPFLSKTKIKIFLWIFFALFALNTLGNLFSLNSLEALIGTPITLILSVLFFRLAID